MSITLRQYLDQYHKKNYKSPSSQNYDTKQLIPLTSVEYEGQKSFQQKVSNIKRLLRTCVEDFQIYLQIQKELQQLKTIFYKNRNSSLFKSKSSIEGCGTIQKSTRSIKHQNRRTNTHTDSLTYERPSIPMIQFNENGFQDLKGTSTQEKNNSQKRINVNIGNQDAYGIKNKNTNSASINRKYKNRIKTQPTQQIQKQIQNRYSFNNIYKNFQIKEVDSKANSQVKIQLPKQEGSPGLKSSKKFNLNQFQNQSCQIHHINLLSPKDIDAQSRVSFSYKDKKIKVDQEPKIKLNGRSWNQFNQRKQLEKIQNNFSFLPPTLETKQSKFSQSEQQINSIRRTDFSKCSYAESKTFYFKK